MRVLAGDIGGTKTLLCVAEVQPAAAPGGAPRVEILHDAWFDSRSWPGLAQVLEAFGAGLSPSQAAELSGAPGRRLPLAAGFGIAGPIRDRRCATTNLPWVVDARELERGQGFGSVALVNDFFALASGVFSVAKDRLAPLQDGARDLGGPCAVIGAGTGLGEALMVPLPGRALPLVLATEGGHTTFAPRDELEAGVQKFLAARHGHVSWERIVCGDGLVNLAEALSALLDLPIPEALGAAIATDRASAPALVSEAARSGERLCTRAVQLFCSLYGAEAGNLALKCLPSGGVWVAGGIAPKLLRELRDGRFREGFLAKGRMRVLLEQFPVQIVLDRQVGLLGAALLAADRAGS